MRATDIVLFGWRALEGYRTRTALMLLAMIDWDWFDDAPDWLGTLIEGSVVPLDWLYERSSLYEAYINWCENVFES